MSDVQGVQQPTDATGQFNLMAFVFRQLMAQNATSGLGLVKAVDTVKRTVDIQPMVHQLDGADNAVPHGTIYGVPYCMIQAGTSAIEIDPVVGDQGAVIYCGHDISSVKANKAPSNPGSKRRFDWSDAIYLCGVGMLNAEPTQFIKFLPNGGGVTIKSAGPITLDGNVAVTGSVMSMGDVKAGTISLMHHTHPGNGQPPTP